MRSLKLCLLAFLTSCLLSKTKGAVPNFCKKAQQEDCLNDQLVTNDFAWTTGSSFDQGKAVPDGEYVEIDMHRALYIVPKSAYQPLNINIRDPDGCSLMHIQDDGYNTMKVKDLAANHQLKQNVNTLIAVLDPGCLLRIPRSIFNGAQLYHVFTRKLDTGKILTSDIDKILKKEQGTYIHSKQKGWNEGNCNPDVAQSNIFYDENEEQLSNDETECYHECMYGSKFEFELDPKGGTPWANKFKLSKECEWMTVYPDGVGKKAPAEVSLRHSFARLPLELKVSAMDFKNADGNGYEVTIAYYRKKINNKNTAHIVIANSHGRAINSHSMYESKQKLLIAFSHDKCLTSVIGAPAERQDDGNKKMESFEFHESYNLGAKVLFNMNKFTSKRVLRNPGSDTVQYGLQKSDVKKIDFTPIDYTPVDHSVGFGAVPTTQKPIDPNATVHTQPSQIVRSISDEDQKKIDEYHEKERQEKMRRRMLFESKNYYTWAIPAGFGAGSFASFLICNIILFVFKRSVLIFWYKAMYKRYGSDTTMGAGTTMGKTVGGETIGGGTTMGGTTAGGETTGTTTAA